jgi:hypothetical protein
LKEAGVEERFGSRADHGFGAVGKIQPVSYEFEDRKTDACTIRNGKSSAMIEKISARH